MNSRNWILAGILAVLVLVIGVVIFNQEDNIQSNFSNINVSPTVTPIKVVTVDLQEQNNSSQSGTVVLTERGSSVIIAINLANSPTDVPQPAHIHIGSCPTPGEIRFPLNNVVNGRSETTINTTLDELDNQLPLAINIHKSAEEQNVFVSCGDIQL